MISSPGGKSDDNRWHLDRRVPIASIVTLLVMVIGNGAWGVWMVAKLDARLTAVESWAKETDTEIAVRREARRIADLELAERLARLEANQQSVLANQQAFMGLLQQIQDRFGRPPVTPR